MRHQRIAVVAEDLQRLGLVEAAVGGLPGGRRPRRRLPGLLGLGLDRRDGVVSGHLEPLVGLHAVVAEVVLAVGAPGVGGVPLVAL